MKRPNLLFLMTDSQRADTLGMVQCGIEVTPNLNRLASQSCCFPRTYNVAPMCVPARTSMFTGKYPTRSGVVYNDFRGVTAQDHKVLQQCLAEAGYDVAHVGQDHVRVKPAVGERVPFALWCAEDDYRRYAAERIPEELATDLSPFRTEVQDLRDGEYVPASYSNPTVAPWPHPAEHYGANYFCRRAVEFLRSPHERPFALFVFLYAPHVPLRAPEPYASMFDPDGLVLPDNVGRVPAQEPANRRRGIAAQLAEGVSPEHWRRAWAAYLGLVRLADEALGTVLDELDAQGLADETLTLFTVDHGEFMGQRQMFQKFEMYEPIIRVPTLVRLPGRPPRSFERPVSHLDLMPTLLELLGLEEPDGLDGLSLARCVTEGVEPPSRPVFSLFSGCYGAGPTRRAVVSEQCKYVYDPDDVPELYDLEADPLEMTNLAADPAHAGTARTLHAALERWAREHGDRVDYSRTPRPGGP